MDQLPRDRVPGVPDPVGDPVHVLPADASTEVPEALAPHVEDTEPTPLRRVPAEVPEGYEFHKDGTATLHLEGRRYALRRPRLGEFKVLREAYHEVQDRSDQLREEAGAASAALRVAIEADPTGEDDATRAATVHAKATSRRVTMAIEHLAVDWLRQTHELLGDHKLPPDDELPPWMEEGANISDLFTHWRTRPLPRGVA